MADEYVYQAEVIRVIDGDTVRLRLFKTFTFTVDFGFYIKERVTSAKSTEMNFRLMGIDTPEIRGVPIEEKERGMAAKEELERLLSLADPDGEIEVETYKPDKYGRWLCTIRVRPYSPNSEFINVNESLVESGHAVPYMV